MDGAVVIARVLAVALSLPGVRDDAHARVRAHDAARVLAALARSEAEARLAIVWAFRESSWRRTAVGDAGHSFGACQNSRAEIAAAGSTVPRVLASLAEGLRVCLATIRASARTCGGLARGLGYVASGRCGHASWLVSQRCRSAGVVCR